MTQLLQQKSVLRIYLDNTDKFNDQPLWKHILEKMKEAKLSGATVFKAVAGIGEHSIIHTFDIFNLSNEMPLIIETVDNEDKLASFLKENKEALQNLFITKHDAAIVSFD